MEEKQIKLTEEELKNIDGLRNLIRQNIESIGNLSVKKHFLDRDLKDVNLKISEELNKTEELNVMEKNLISEIVTKYGEGQLDFETGIYTRN